MRDVVQQIGAGLDDGAGAEHRVDDADVALALAVAVADRSSVRRLLPRAELGCQSDVLLGHDPSRDAGSEHARHEVVHFGGRQVG